MTQTIITPSYRYKIVVIGEGGVGKTTLLYRYVKGTFLDNARMTIGSDLFTKQILLDVDAHQVKISYLIWDVSGEQRFRFIIGDYINGARCFLMLFDLSRPSTLQKLIQWRDLVQKLSIEKKLDIDFFLVGTKKDLVKADSNVFPDMINHFRETNKIDMYIETSAKNGLNIDKLFYIVGQKLYRKFTLKVPLI